MTTQQQHILACIDGSNVTESVCDYATWYANRLSLSVGLLHVVDIPASARRIMSKAIGQDSRQSLFNELVQLDDRRAKIANEHSQALIADAKSYLTNQSAIKVDTYQHQGKLLAAIESLEPKNHAVVIGRRGEDHQHNQVNIGSRIETIARASKVPILICSEPFKTPTSYMVAFDPNATAIKVIDMILESPLLKDMKGYIVMVGNDNDSSKESLQDALKQLRSAGFEVSAHHIPGAHTVNKLLTFHSNNNVDIIIIGAYAGSKLRQLFVGSTTTEIIANTSSPILLVR